MLVSLITEPHDFGTSAGIRGAVRQQDEPEDDDRHRDYDLPEEPLAGSRLEGGVNHDPDLIFHPGLHSNVIL